jgi:hypothetical protein
MGSGFRISAFTTLKTIAFTPIPRASDTIAVSVKVGARTSVRIAYRRSARKSSNNRSPV